MYFSVVHKVQVGYSANLVISPLVSLMADQVSALQGRRVAAVILSGNEGVDKRWTYLKVSFVAFTVLFAVIIGGSYCLCQLYLPLL